MFFLGFDGFFFRKSIENTIISYNFAHKAILHNYQRQPENKRYEKSSFLSPDGSFSGPCRFGPAQARNPCRVAHHQQCPRLAKLHFRVGTENVAHRDPRQAQGRQFQHHSAPSAGEGRCAVVVDLPALDEDLHRQWQQESLLGTLLVCHR